MYHKKFIDKDAHARVKHSTIIISKDCSCRETKHNFAAATAQLDALVEDIIIKKGFLPEDFYNKYYAEQRKSAKVAIKRKY
jgi:hypothetical protein